MNLSEHDNGTTTNLQEQESGQDEPTGTRGNLMKALGKGIREYGHLRGGKWTR
jgi:hypothetical protein